MFYHPYSRRKKIVAILLFSVQPFVFYAQNAGTEEQTNANAPENLNWYNQDPEEDDIMGVGAERAYEYLKERKSEVRVVAVLDSGVDIDHKDLKNNIWINEDEIPENGIDDDNNGYIDDVYGWNFLGNESGENLVYENLEFVRNVKRYEQRFGGKKSTEISDADSADYNKYIELKHKMEKEQKKANEEYKDIAPVVQAVKIASQFVATYLNKSEYTIEEMEAIETDYEPLVQSRDLLVAFRKDGITEEYLEEYFAHVQAKKEYYYNSDYNGRLIIGDDPSSISDSIYGNEIVGGDYSDHGTHVAGIIGAVRNNNYGVDGIANNVKIMPVRVVPDGDERDKDVALGIRYAVNNGANIINMSFGKQYSPYKEMVDDAIQYAKDHNVLVIHAAGNESDNIDEEMYYPSNILLNGDTLTANYMIIGASSASRKKDMVGDFSNYGHKMVDFFAPGVDVYSTVPGNKFQSNSGTSMACPAASGVAALVWSYFPELSAEQLKTVLEKSVYVPKRKKVLNPDSKGKKKVKFSDLSQTGGIVNAYLAIKYAEQLLANGE